MRSHRSLGVVQSCEPEDWALQEFYDHRVATFALVHGSWCGAWCWELLIPHLLKAGHDVVAVDLPCEDSSATFDTYADVVCAAVDDQEDVIAVGHSLGANTIPLVAARRRIRHLVYVCGVIPAVGQTVAQQLDSRSGMMQPGWNVGLSEPDSLLRTRWIDPQRARAVLYGDCDDPTAAATFARLRRQSRYPLTLPFSLSEFPAVGCTSVVCTDDQMVDPAWSKRIARERLAANLIELPGGHFPALSRPSALADVLVGVADTA